MAEHHIAIMKLLISLTLAAVVGHAHTFVVLVDLGSSHCFVDEQFAKRDRLSITKLDKEIPLWLFDGLALTSVSKKTNLTVTFATGKIPTVECFITRLDQGYMVILGYNWLTQHNPVIDWVETKVVFYEGWARTKNTTSAKINIRGINLEELTELYWTPGNLLYTITHALELHLVPTGTAQSGETTSGEGETLEGILLEYWEFQDVFSGEKVDQLPLHFLYNLKIKLEEGAIPFHGPVYSLSQPELPHYENS